MALEVRDSSGMNVVGEAAHEQTLARYRDYVTTSFVAAVEPIAIGKAEGAKLAAGGGDQLRPAAGAGLPGGPGTAAELSPCRPRAQSERCRALARSSPFRSSMTIHGVPVGSSTPEAITCTTWSLWKGGTTTAAEGISGG